MVIDVEEHGRFELTESFLSEYEDKPVNWGYGDLSWVTYKRTYSRDGEDWWQTCRRVIEGMFTVQRVHCLERGLPWDDDKARRFARKAYDRLFEFKWTPPGRGLWQMGTDYIFERGGTALNNCGFTSTKNIDEDYSDPFCWMFGMSMLGVGVGFDTRGSGTVEIVEPEQGQDVHVIGDSREGWSEALRRLLDAYVGDDTLPVEWDFSEIRPKGAPIESFGGVASGPDPLERMIEDVQDIHDRYIGREVDSELIVDTMNLVGRCVVSGGVRRTAQLSLGDPEDEQFLDLKTDPEKVKEYRWASNNSVFAEVGMDYSDVADRTGKNGEPGYQWLETARARGRLKDESDWNDENAMGTNPCVTGDTKVAVADGRNAVPIRKLAEEGRDVPVYSVDPETGKVSIKIGRNPRKTGTDEKLLRVKLDDGGFIDVTPNHSFLLRDGTEVEACQLEKGDSLCRFTKNSEKLDQENGTQYYRVYCDTRDAHRDKIFEHRLIAKFAWPDQWEKMYDPDKKTGWSKGGVVVHHNDEDTLNNRLGNLEIMPFGVHAKHHADRNAQGAGNGRYSGFTNDEIKNHAISLTEELGRRFSIEEWREYCEETGVPKGPYNNFRSDGGWFETMHGLSKWAATECDVEYVDKDPRMVRTYQEVLSQGYDARIEDRVEVEKHCESCGKSFWIDHRRREQSYCSKSCHNESYLNLDEEVHQKRVANQKEYFENEKAKRRDKQARIYHDLKQKLGEKPLKKQWVEACKEEGIPYRTGKKSPFRSWSDVVEAGDNYNHTVVEVIELPNTEDVYNITVDDNHTVAYITGCYENKHENPNWNGVFTFQCGEQTLWDRELCCLVETYPAHHDDLEDYKETLRVAYQYAKTVTLIPTNDSKTNAVMLRNRRIGCSMTGIVQALNKHGYRNFFDWCDEGYEYIQHLDKKYSDWLCVPRSIKTTSVKPSGTVSILAGATPGVHWDHSPYYIRRIRVRDTHPLVSMCEEAGYEVEQDEYADDTAVISFPVEVDGLERGKTDVPLREKMDLAARIQHYWADNQVSCTAEFDPDTEADEIPRLLEAYEDRLKGISFLPSKEHGYVQPPYEEIDEDTYRKMKASVQPLRRNHTGDLEHDQEDKFCSGEACKVDLGGGDDE